MEKGMRLGSVETDETSIDEVLRLYKCVPLCFFAFCCVVAAEAVFLEEDEEEEDEEEEVDCRALLGALGMNVASG
jgi:aspartate/methionine/tyrosine aminotransferase